MKTILKVIALFITIFISIGYADIAAAEDLEPQLKHIDTANPVQVALGMARFRSFVMTLKERTYIEHIAESKPGDVVSIEVFGYSYDNLEKMPEPYIKFKKGEGIPIETILKDLKSVGYRPATVPEVLSIDHAFKGKIESQVVFAFGTIFLVGPERDQQVVGVAFAGGEAEEVCKYRSKPGWTRSRLLIAAVKEEAPPKSGQKLEQKGIPKK